MVSRYGNCKKRGAADLQDLTTTISTDAKKFIAMLDIVVASLRLALQAMRRVRADNDAKAGLTIKIKSHRPRFSRMMPQLL